MKDELLIALGKHNTRIYIASTTNLVQQAKTYFNAYPTSLAALGRTLSMTAVMGQMLKGERESVNVTINGGGEIGTIMAISKNDGSVKGFCSNPYLYEKDNDKLAVGKIVGVDGYLSVTKDLHMQSRYTTQVKLQSGEIGDDFAFYFAKSEQRPSIVSLGVLVNESGDCESSGVFFVELLPGFEEEDIVYLEDILKKMRPISELLREYQNLESIVGLYFEDTEILERKDLRYECDCSKDRFAQGLLTLSESDLEELSQQEEIEIRCDFCNKIYKFSKQEILDLRKKNV